MLGFRPAQRRRLVLTVCAASALALAVAYAALSTPSGAPTVLATDRLPLAFVPNVGQTAPEVSYLVHGWSGGTVFFTFDEVVLALPPAGPVGGAIAAEAGTPLTKAGLPRHDLHRQLAPAIGLRFVGASSAGSIEGAHPQPGHVNYIVGRDPDGWHGHVPTFGGVQYRDVYPGVDLTYDGSGGLLKGTWRLRPGASPEVIRWRYDGVRDWSVRADGALVLTVDGTPGEEDLRALVEQAPSAWQQIDGRRREVEVRYSLLVDGTIGFALGAYDSELPLVIDPTILFSTYLGGAARDHGFSVDLDAAGNLFVAGGTSSADFPVAAAMKPTRGPRSSYYLADAFVTKLSPDGSTMLFSTFFGGDNDGEDALDVRLDPSGDVWIVGTRLSDDLPLAKG